MRFKFLIVLLLSVSLIGCFEKKPQVKNPWNEEWVFPKDDDGGIYCVNFDLLTNRFYDLKEKVEALEEYLNINYVKEIKTTKTEKSHYEIKK